VSERSEAERLAQRRSLALDLLLAAAVAATGVAQALRSPADGLIDQAWASIVVSAAAAAALSWRRRRPMAVAAVVVAMTALEPNPLALWIGLYTAAAYIGAGVRLWIICAVAALVSAGPVYVGTGPNPLGVLANAVFGVGIPVLFGLWVGTRRRLLASLRDRAARLEREQHLLADRARIEERAQIAREMHDVVAHRVSLIVLQAGALEVAAAHDPAEAAHTAAVIRSTGRQALEELRSLIGVLRTGRDGGDDDSPLAPQPTLADLSALVAASRSAGLDVSLAVAGVRRPLDAVVERTAYLIAQEALTNAHKHAGSVTAQVSLNYQPAAMTVEVTNAAPVAGDPPPSLPSGGNGLIGLRERANLLGGTFEAGPQRYGGWRVRAVLPATPLSREEHEP